MKKYYLDTCIWLNLFKKECNLIYGIKSWKLIKDFIHKIQKRNDQILISTIVLKELRFKLKNRFFIVKKFLRKNKTIPLIKTIPDDYDLARIIETENDFGIGFLDCLHIALASRLKMVLITRDKALIRIGRRYIQIAKPEDLIKV